MPRRKISVEQAFQVLEEAGIQVQVRSVKETIQPEKVQHPDIFKNTQSDKTILRKVGNTAVTVKLFAKHSIGSGGSIVVGSDGKRVENAGVQTYGPGVCTVPVHLVEQLLYADAQARAADERMLEREQRSYLITQKISVDGQRVNVGVQVPNEIFNDGFGNLPSDFVHIIRGR